MIYALIFVMLFVPELGYLRFARKFGITDVPTWRSSHTSVTVSGGGIIFVLAVWLFWLFFGFRYTLFLTGLTLVGAVSFMDDVRSMPIWPRLIVQILSVILLLCQLGAEGHTVRWFVAALVIGTGITNMFNFMDGINGMTGIYSIAVLLPLIYLNHEYAFVAPPFLYTVGLSLTVFLLFNFRKRALCFPGDVGGISIGFILLFAVGLLIVRTGDYSYLTLMIVYAADVIPTMMHLIMIRENPARSHRRYCYQIMANELRGPHLVVATSYAMVQLVISAGLIFLPVNHYLYMFGTATALSAANICFRMKYYHLHSAYLRTRR